MNKKRLFAYRFKGYWRDVGTVKSLWEANMDLLEMDCELDLYDYSWPIYSVSQYLPPHYIDECSELNDVLINEGCKVYGKVSKSLLFYDVEVEINSVVSHSVIMPNVVIKRDCELHYCIVEQGLVVPKNTVVIGSRDHIILVSKTYINKHKGKVRHE